jgi:hypothetical protein
MTIDENLIEFDGKPVLDYAPDDGLSAAETTAYRVRIDWSAYDEGRQLSEVLASLLAEREVGRLRALVVGAWSFDSSRSSADIVEMLVASANVLGNLQALFLGDIIVEEQEISWIKQSDISPLFLALPELRVLRVRGGDGLEVGTIRHDRLRELAFETGGLPGHVIQAVATATLPQLERLELWLGEENYGYDGTLDMLEPLLGGGRFPRLRYLGIKNSEHQDDIARMVAASPVLDQLEVLDLSMGTLTDAGAEALLASGKLRALRKLDIHHHYVSDEVVARLRQTVAQLDDSLVQKGDESDGEVYRYIAVSE